MTTHIRLACCGLLLTVFACTDLKSPEDRADGGGSGAGAANGGEGSAGAGMSGQTGGSAGMSGGSAGNGGQSGNAGGTSGGNSGAGGTSSDSGADEDTGITEALPDGGEDSGDGEVEPDPDGPIHGKLIDYYENAVPNMPVTLNGVTVMTDDDGEFEFGETPETYSISVSLEVARFGAVEDAGYLFVDLTRRDPTLQVYRGLPMRGADVTRNVTATFPLPSTQKIQLDFAGQYGGFYDDIDASGFTSSGDWEGPEEVQGHVHAIRWVNSSSSPTLPTSYLAHASAPLALDDSAPASFTLDVSSDGPLGNGIVTGNVTSVGTGTRFNNVFVRFSDDAAVQVLSHTSPSASYSYLVPSIPSSSITVAATRSYQSFPPFAVAYQEGVAPGESDVDLEIPVPATLGSPAANATNVDESTVFNWTGPDQVYMFVAKRVSFAENFYVITANKQATLPLSHVTLPSYVANAAYTWSVRTHLKLATVDEATGPGGYLDSYCYDRLRGPRRGSGTHTQTATSSFTSKP